MVEETQTEDDEYLEDGWRNQALEEMYQQMLIETQSEEREDSKSDSIDENENADALIMDFRVRMKGYMTSDRIDALVEMYLQQQEVNIPGKTITTMASDANIRIEVGRIKRKLYQYELAKAYFIGKFTKDQLTTEEWLLMQQYGENKLERPSAQCIDFANRYHMTTTTPFESCEDENPKQRGITDCQVKTPDLSSKTSSKKSSEDKRHSVRRAGKRKSQGKTSKKNSTKKGKQPTQP